MLEKERQYLKKIGYEEIIDNTFMINIADLKNPMTGKTYHEENAVRQHTIPIGTLVEDVDTGIRLFVVRHIRDCDQTPLYCLGPDPDDTKEETPGFANRHWICGYPEDALKTIQ